LKTDYSDKSYLKSKKFSSKKFLKIYNTLYKSFGPQNWWPGDTPFEIMVGAILTQNTNWRNVSKAIENIKEAKLLSPKKLLKHRRMIPCLIRPSGFYNIKSKRLIDFLKYYVNNYHGNLKKMKTKRTEFLRRELLNIPGIGHETADSILLYALSRPVFVIDAYTRRVFSRHNIFDYDLPYDEIRLLFEKNLPRNIQLYNEYHALLVKLGKDFCKKKKSLCKMCPLRSDL
jgi:endonuclease-3 related protein